ncbi:MAG TPA: Rrf2 family transcriptional regulator [Patescibacteria group bacterium]
MITVPKKVEYSIILISYLSKNKGETISLTDVAKRLYLPYRFLGQISGALKAIGVLESKEGKNGGYYLAQGWEDKTIYDVMDALGENKHMVKCLASGEKCLRENTCEIKNIFNKIEDKFVDELKAVKLKEI